MRPETYKERLKDWTDFDGATWDFLVLLGLLPEWGAEPGKDPWHGLKGVVWSGNKTSDLLSDIMMRMVEAGMLLRNEDSQFKWNPDYKVDQG